MKYVLPLLMSLCVFVGLTVAVYAPVEGQAKKRAVAPPFAGEAIGRYQMAVGKSTSGPAIVLLIDTTTGEIWTKNIGSGISNKWQVESEGK